MTWTPIVGRGFTVLEFEAHVASLAFTGWQPKFVVVHNTSAPDAKLYRQWQTRSGWTGEQWLRNLESYYRGMGWKAGPHLFVAPDRIWAFTPLTSPGTHSPAWNSRTWGVETVGEFEREPFDNGVRDNLVAALGIMHARIGLNPSDYKFGVRGIHFHKEDPVTTHKTCPGHNIIKSDLVADVDSYMHAANGGDHVHVPEHVHEAATAAMTDEEMTSVAWLQASLNRLGAAPALTVDGNLGAKSRAAVKSFQSAHPPLKADGFPGPMTRLAIKATLHV